jgi:hypothetical protein
MKTLVRIVQLTLLCSALLSLIVGFYLGILGWNKKNWGSILNCTVSNVYDEQKTINGWSQPTKFSMQRGDFGGPFRFIVHRYSIEAKCPDEPHLMKRIPSWSGSHRQGQSLQIIVSSINRNDIVPNDWLNLYGAALVWVAAAFLSFVLWSLVPQR